MDQVKKGEAKVFSNKNLAGQGYKFDENEKNKSKVKSIFLFYFDIILKYVVLGNQKTIEKTIWNGVQPERPRRRHL